MSTKIYNGYIFTETDFFTLNKKLQDLAVKMKALKMEHAAREAARIYSAYVDEVSLFGRNPIDLENFQGDSVLEFLEALEKKAKESNSSPYRSQGDFDFECSVSLYPLSSGKILCQFFEQKVVKGYESLWKRQKYVKDFHYQNSTDKPKNITMKAWKERERLWNEALARSSRPVDSGPSFILASGDFPTFEIYSGENSFRNFFPSKKERYDKAFEEYGRHQFFKKPEMKERMKQTSEWFSAFRECKDWQVANEATLKEAFHKTYGDKFLDLEKVVKEGLKSIKKGHLE